MIKDWTIRTAEEIEREQVLVCNKAFARFVDGHPPSVRRNTYEQVPVWRTYAGFYSDPRSPVIMRGSRYACFRRYSGSWSGLNASSTHWGREIIERYLRRYKYTSFDYVETSEYVHKLMRRVQDKIGGMTRDYPSNVISMPSRNPSISIWLNGKHIWLDTMHQYNYIKRLYRIAHKIEKVTQ